MPIQETMASEKFSVDLQGVVDLLSNHLYSGPQVFIRELLQNAVDATAARRALDPTVAGRVQFETGTHKDQPALHVTITTKF